jgi:hypothetical protein
MGRCLIFETSSISFHGVAPLKCPPNEVRRSFAAYYYTKEAPAGWDGTRHSTIFRARPEERWKGLVAMPIEKAADAAKNLPAAAPTCSGDRTHADRRFVRKPESMCGIAERSVQDADLLAAAARRRPVPSRPDADGF